MKALIYAGSRFTTGDAIADALMAYSRALAETQRAETVDIPVRHTDGTTGLASFLVGPASQIVAEDADGDGDAEEVTDDDLVAELAARTRALFPRADVESEPAPPVPFLDELED